MDYTHEHSIVEFNTNEPFRGWLTRLLAEAFYLEEEVDLPDIKHPKHLSEQERQSIFAKYAKPF
ncbi:MAG: hypothetical protein OHK0056_29700 [Bacteriovoracaceae bacterium]